MMRKSSESQIGVLGVIVIRAGVKTLINVLELTAESPASGIVPVTVKEVDPVAKAHC